MILVHAVGERRGATWHLNVAWEQDAPLRCLRIAAQAPSVRRAPRSCAQPTCKHVGLMVLQSLPATRYCMLALPTACPADGNAHAGTLFTNSRRSLHAARSTYLSNRMSKHMSEHMPTHIWATQSTDARPMNVSWHISYGILVMACYLWHRHSTYERVRLVWSARPVRRRPHRHEALAVGPLRSPGPGRARRVSPARVPHAGGADGGGR